MTAITLDLPRKFPWPALLSIAMHGVVIAGLLSITARQTIQFSAPSQPISVTLLAPAGLESAKPKIAPPESAAEPEPEVAAQPKLAPVVIHKPEPRPKPKPKTHTKIKAKPVPEPDKRVLREAPRNSVLSQMDNVREGAAHRAPVNPGPASPVATVNAPHAVSRTQPQYPSRAYALRLEGSVRVKFDVTNDGRVDNITVLSATPQNMFEREVKQAMKRWRYQSGRPGQGLIVNIIFKINGGARVQ